MVTVSKLWRRVIVSISISIPLLVVAVLVVKRLTALPTLTILASGLVFVFLFNLALVFALLRSAEHKDLRNAFLVFLLPMPLYALSAFLGASERTEAYGFGILFLTMIAHYTVGRSYVRKSLRRIGEQEANRR